MKLYELTGEILALQNAAYDATDEEFEELKERFSAAKIELSDKLENCARVLHELDLDCEQIKAEEKRLKAKREQLERRYDWLHGYIGNCLGQGNAYKTPLFNFTWRKSSSVEITGDVPEQYQRVKTITEPDKKQIGDDLKAGAAFDFAQLVEKQTLSIK